MILVKYFFNYFKIIKQLNIIIKQQQVWSRILLKKAQSKKCLFYRGTSLCLNGDWLQNQWMQIKTFNLKLT